MSFKFEGPNSKPLRPSRPNYEYWRKSRIRNQLRLLNENWPSHYSFIFIRTHKEEWRLLFVDDLDAEEALRLAQESIPNPLRNRKHFGFYLRAWRRTRKLRLKDMQELCGISFQNLSLIENGRRYIGQNTRDRITNAMRTYDFLQGCSKHPETKL